MNAQFIFCFIFFYCTTFSFLLSSNDTKAPRITTTEAVCTTCIKETNSAKDCVCNELTVIGKAHIHDTVIVDGNIKAKNNIIATTFETTCGSTLGCDLLVENNAIIAHDLSVGETLTTDSIHATMLTASIIETSCGSTLGCSLFVQDDATITDNLSVGGTLTVGSIDANTLAASIIETSCGSTLGCDLLVQDDATITDALTVGCDISVGCNILMNNSTDTDHGNIIKNSTRFMHNSGTNNTFLGQESGTFAATGSDNVGFGYQTLTTLTSGVQNTAIGSKALLDATLVANNTAIGYAALQNTTDAVNCCTPILPGAFPFICGVGGECLYSGNLNTAVGSQALQNNLVGNNNVAIGANALSTSTTLFNTSFCAIYPPEDASQAAGAAPADYICTFSGENNTAVGTNSLMNVSFGSSNIAVGYNAGANLVNGFNNIEIGNQGALTSLQVPLTSFPTIPVGTNANENNVIRIGDVTIHTDMFIAGVYGKPMGADTVLPVYINDRGELGTTLSSARFKEQIASLDSKTILEKVSQLNPVSFIYKSQKQEETPKEQIGLIAEQVVPLFPELVVYDQDGKPLSIRYDLLAVLCIAALQSIEKQQKDTSKIVETLQKQVEELQMRL